MTAMPSAERQMKRPVVIALMVVVPFGLGYFISYLFRTVNAVISPQLTSEIGLSAGDLGLLTSIYFIVFAAFQLPLGVMLDRYGPRQVQAALMVVAAAGSAIFAIGETFMMLAIGRGLIGLGVSGCLMAALQANVLWWPRERLPLVNSFTAAFGSIGALVSTVPVELLLQTLGWRGVFVVLAALSFAVAALIFFATPDRARAPADRQTGGFDAQLRDLKEVYTSAFFWRVSVLVFVHNAAFLSYQSLWTGAWLRDVAGLDRLGVANGLLMFNLGMFIGALGIGFVADRIQAFGIKPIVTVGAGIGVSICVQMIFALGVTVAPQALCFSFGFFGSATLVIYAVLGQNFPQRLIGRVNTAQNMLIFIAAFGAQWGIGAIIDLWPVTASGGYHPDAQAAAMYTMIGLQVAGFVWFVWPQRARQG